MTILAILSADAIDFREIRFPDRGTADVAVDAARIARTGGDHGALGGEPLARPVAEPYPAARGSRFSTLYRARDIHDIARYPARAVAKLFRLDAKGERSVTACTAQFVGPRHLLTAGHCIVDRTTGKPHDGFEVATLFDAGNAVPAPVSQVVRAWIPTDQLVIRDAKDALVTPERCDDFAVIEIAEPAGAATGWLGMTTEVAADTPLRRFSYPHQSAATRLWADAEKPGLPDQARGFIRSEAERLTRTEPDFAPTSLYYEFGRPDGVEPSHVADRNGYVAPGRSGSALMDGENRIVALLSRSYGGISYSCRLSGAQIGAIAAIARPAS